MTFTQKMNAFILARPGWSKAKTAPPGHRWYTYDGRTIGIGINRSEREVAKNIARCEFASRFDEFGHEVYAALVRSIADDLVALINADKQSFVRATIEPDGDRYHAQIIGSSPVEFFGGLAESMKFISDFIESA